MRNRSIFSLPSYYVPAQSTWESEREPQPGPLEVFDITYLHFHSLLELGVCAQGRGCCIVEDREYPFVQGDVQIIFPFQRHLSRSEGGEYSQWLWCSLEPLSLLGQWGAPDLARMERLLYTGMGHPYLRPGGGGIRGHAAPGASARPALCAIGARVGGGAAGAAARGSASRFRPGGGMRSEPRPLPAGLSPGAGPIAPGIYSGLPNEKGPAPAAADG